MNGLEKTIKDFWGWYKGLKWYWKILGSVLLIVLAVLAILGIAAKIMAPGPRTEADEEHAATVDTALEGQEEIRKKLDEALNLKKKELYKSINSAAKIDAKTLKRRQQIYEADTMEELDELQRKLGL